MSSGRLRSPVVLLALVVCAFAVGETFELIAAAA
jgi:hypothetical protein